MRYHGSGYQRANIWRFLKKLPWDDEQSVIFRAIILQQIEAAGPEFKEIARTATSVDSADFRESLNALILRSDKDYVRQRAKRLLALLEAKS